MILIRSSGRGRLPVWVVKMRSVSVSFPMTALR
jgi:hypothetical protein